MVKFITAPSRGDEPIPAAGSLSNHDMSIVYCREAAHSGWAQAV